MFGLIPRNEKFFEMFVSMTKNIVEGAHLLKEMLDNFSDPKASQQKIKEIEHKADLQTHEIIKKLNKSFITPFDREDIYALASALDNILDTIDVCSQHLIIYNIKSITTEAKELGFLIVKSCEMVAKAVSTLGGKTEHMTEYCIEVNSLEGEADRVRTEAIQRLFNEEKDPIELIKWKELYENLERVTDECEYAANRLESVVMKNA